MLRMPPGHAVVLVAVLIGTIVLSYWVGFYRGDAGGFRRGQQKLQAQADAIAARRERYAPDSSQSGAGDGGGVPLPRGTAPVPEGRATASGGDSREVGLNYWVLSRLPADEADRLCGFLKDSGVDSFANPLDDRGLCEVIALNGFRGESGEAQRFKGELLKLGRIWKNDHRGPEAFVTMYLRKYTRPQASSAAAEGQ